MQKEYLLQDKFKDNQGNSIRKMVYKSDFVIDDWLIIDSKGMETSDFKLKKKLLLYKLKDTNLVFTTCKSVKNLKEILESYKIF